MKHLYANLYTWSAILAVVFASVVGDVLLSRAMKQVGDVGALRRRRGLWTVIVRVLSNQNFVLGVAAMAVAFFSLLFALSWGDVSLVAPAAASLTFIGNAFAAKIFLHERVDQRRWIAAVLVAAGVALLAGEEAEFPAASAVRFGAPAHQRVRSGFQPVAVPVRNARQCRMNVWLQLVVIAALAFGALDLGVAQSKAGPSSKILALESKWNEAYKHGDVATMESLLADDFVITVEDGRTFSKSGYIAHNTNSALHVEISDMAEVKVRMHANVAVVTGAYHEKGTSKGKPYESRDRATDVWMRNANGGWQVIAAHYSIPASQ